MKLEVSFPQLFDELKTDLRTLLFAAHVFKPPLQYFALGSKKAG